MDDLIAWVIPLARRNGLDRADAPTSGRALCAIRVSRVQTSLARRASALKNRMLLRSATDACTGKLMDNKRGVKTAFGKQFVVRPNFGDMPLIHGDDHIGIAHG